MRMYIYALIDPNTDEVRYVGRSKHAEKRLSEHISYAKITSTPKARWIKGLLANGQKPKIKVLESTTKENGPAREGHWIQHFKESGASLLNRRGADGVVWKRVSLELTRKHVDRLNELAAELGCLASHGTRVGQPSWRVLLSAIADGKVMVRRKSK